MKKEDIKIIVITVLTFTLVVIMLNIIQSIDKNEMIVTHLYDIEIQKIDKLNKYLIYEKGLIMFRDAARESNDDTIDYVVANKSTITYVAGKDSIIKIYHTKYKNPIQEFVVNKNKGKLLAEILIPAGTVEWNGSNDNTD